MQNLQIFISTSSAFSRATATDGGKMAEKIYAFVKNSRFYPKLPRKTKKNGHFWPFFTKNMEQVTRVELAGNSLGSCRHTARRHLLFSNANRSRRFHYSPFLIKCQRFFRSFKKFLCNLRKSRKIPRCIRILRTRASPSRAILSAALDPLLRPQLFRISYNARDSGALRCNRTALPPPLSLIPKPFHTQRILPKPERLLHVKQ